MVSMTTPDPLASGDLIAERRFAYAKAAAKEGDWSAAAELYEQTVEPAPHWAAAWFALAEAQEKLADLDAAAQAFRATLAADPADAQGAMARLALIGRGDAPPALPQAYVARLFDDYAWRFDKHLIKNLGYRAPALIAEALSAVASGRRFAAALDLGCGTGLMGEALCGRIDHLTGVDLSAGMIAKARERGVGVMTGSLSATRRRCSGASRRRSSISSSPPTCSSMSATLRLCSLLSGPR